MKISSMKYLIKEGFRNIWSNRLMSIASIGVLISCLLLTGAAALFSLNVNTAMESVEQKNSTTVYLKQSVATLDAIQIGEKIKSVPNVRECEFYSKDEAIEQYVDDLGVIFEDLQGADNPLPHAFHITMDNLSQYDETVKNISKIDGVDIVSNRSDTAEKLTRISDAIYYGGFWVILILSVVSLFIISNTISMTMYSRRLEISIMKSVGATNGFIRIPFLVEGMIIGLISSLVSIGLLKLGYDYLIVAINQVIPFTSIPFNNIALEVSLAFVIAGLLFGIIGGMISINKYLKREGGDIIGW